METRLFKRQIYDEIARYVSTDDIIVIHGARQVGKTSILMYFQYQLRERPEQKLYIDLEDSRFVSLLDRGVDEFLQYLAGEGHDFSSLKTGRREAFCVHR